MSPFRDICENVQVLLQYILIALVRISRAICSITNRDIDADNINFFVANFVNNNTFACEKNINTRLFSKIFSKTANCSRPKHSCLEFNHHFLDNESKYRHWLYKPFYRTFPKKHFWFYTKISNVVLFKRYLRKSGYTQLLLTSPLLFRFQEPFTQKQVEISTLTIWTFYSKISSQQFSLYTKFS